MIITMSEFKASKFFDTLESSFRHEFDSKVKEVNVKWKELQSTVQNLTTDATETFRIRGENAEKEDEVLYWKEVH